MTPGCPGCQRGHIAVGYQDGHEHGTDVLSSLRVRRGHNAITARTAAASGKTAEMAFWDVSLVTDDEQLCSVDKDHLDFQFADISRWDVRLSSVTNMAAMFDPATTRSIADHLSEYLSSVINMAEHVHQAYAFNQRQFRAGTSAPRSREDARDVCSTQITRSTRMPVGQPAWSHLRHHLF